MTQIRQTRDAYVGLEAPTEQEWTRWHEAMLAERAAVLAASGFDARVYEDPRTAWSDRSFRQYFLFMYDASFFDRARGRYRTDALIDRWRRHFGRVDEVLLWHAYPRIGFDRRSQFDFYRDMPGGLAGLRAEVSDVLHACGMRVFVDYNPWAEPHEGAYDELAEIVASLDADGVMLDTMTEVPEALARAVGKRRTGVVFAPELRPNDADLRHVRESWAQWYELGDASMPTIYRQRWLVPRHRQLAIARWDHSRRRDIVHSFFNGSGLVLWENVFGTWNPYGRADRRLLAETAAVLDRYGDLVVHGTWRPLVPTGVKGLDANEWSDGKRVLVTLRNRTDRTLAWRPPGIDGAWLAFWGELRRPAPGEVVEIEAGGAQALVLDTEESARDAWAHFEELGRRADVDMPDDDARSPPPRLLLSPARARARATASEGTRVAIPGGVFAMRTTHERRECGCYPLGAGADATWGWYYEDTIVHERTVDVDAFEMRATAVTNAEFLAFVHDAGYRPRDAARFLAHIARGADGALPRILAEDQAALPVTFVSLDDARAFAAHRGERLPTEAEWQWAAEGCGRARRFPWGDDERSFPEALRPARDEATATPQGVMGLSGNAWELTESEHEDGHTRFVMLRGGVFLAPGASEWLPKRGARPNDWHAKYILLADGLDRSEGVSFRTVA